MKNMEESTRIYPEPTTVLAMNPDELWSLHKSGIRKHGDPTCLIEFAQAYERRARSLGILFLEMEALVLQMVSLTFQGKIDEVANVRKRFLDLRTRLHTRREFLFFYCCLGTLSEAMDQQAKAVSYLLKAAEFYDNNPEDARIYAQVCHSLTNVYFKSGMFPEALHWMLIVLELQENRVVRSSPNSYYVAALIYQKAGDKTRAAEFIQLMRRMCRDLKDEHFEARILLLDASELLNCGDNDAASIEAALDTAEQAVQMLELQHHFSTVCEAQLIQISALRRLRRFAEMRSILDGPELNSATTPWIVAARMKEYGHLLLESGEPAAAVEKLLLLEEEWLHGLDGEDKCVVMEVLSKAYLQLDQLELARTYTQKYHETMLQSHSIEFQRQIAQAEIQKEIRRAEREVQNLRSELQSANDHIRDSDARLTELTIRLDRNREQLTTIKQQIYDIAAKSVGRRRYFAENLINMIDASIDDLDESGRELDIGGAFTEVLTNLSTHCPELTATELKVCVYLRMALSSKEIASILCKSHETIRSHRRNIRRKLKPGKRNLAAYLMELGNKEVATGMPTGG